MIRIPVTGRLVGQEQNSAWIFDGTGRTLSPVAGLDTTALPGYPVGSGALFEFQGVFDDSGDEISIPLVALLFFHGLPWLVALSGSPCKVPWIIKPRSKPVPV